MKQPVLSLGMIFKNDTRCLERCLKSLEPLRKALPCELVMADTGSTDGSREIATRYADVLFDFPWVDDFAAARNAVLDRCSGEWFMAVDTDEWLDPDFKQLVQFLKSKDQKNYDLGSVIGRNYQDKQLKVYGDFYSMRLGRLCGGALRYRGPIHEYLVYENHKTKGMIALPYVIFHHDGYMEVEPGHIQEKIRRNMTLLEAELEKRPEDLRTLAQCIDSAGILKEKRKYADLARDILKRENGTPIISDVVAYQKCCQIYYEDLSDDLVLECYHEWKDRCPESALLRMDGEALAAGSEYRKGNYESALEHIRNHDQALAEQTKGEDLRRADRLYSQYNTDNARWYSTLEAIRFQSLCTLERYPEANEQLKMIRQEDLTITDRGVIVLRLLNVAEHLPASSGFLCQCWDYCHDNAHWKSAEEASDQQKAAEDLMLMLQSYLERSGEDGLELLAQMGDRAPGRSARILLTQDAREIAQEWDAVSEWKWMLPEAYSHTMKLRLPFPTAFYRQPSEQMAALTALLAKRPAFLGTAFEWVTESALPETPAELTWRLDLLTASLRTWNWTEEPAQGEALCALYADLSAAYLDNIYNPELLNEEDLSILPGMQRYAWYYRRALAAWQEGDELGYVRSLRSALGTAPAMKGMIDFLLEHKPKTVAQQHLEDLAAKMQVVLSQYKPDDPAVRQLLDRPEYQRLLPLLGPEYVALYGATAQDQSKEGQP